MGQSSCQRSSTTARSLITEAGRHPERLFPLGARAPCSKSGCTWNMHELVIWNEKTAGYFVHRTTLMNLALFGLSERLAIRVAHIADLGIREVDLRTGRIWFEWWASDFISLNQSTAIMASIDRPLGWNWMYKSLSQIYE